MLDQIGGEVLWWSDRVRRHVPRHGENGSDDIDDVCCDGSTVKIGTQFRIQSGRKCNVIRK